MTKLQDVFTHALDLKGTVEFDSLAYGSHWDSITHMQLIAALEKRFDILIETDDVIAMSSFKKAAEILRRYGVDTDA